MNEEEQEMSLTQKAARYISTRKVKDITFGGHMVHLKFDGEGMVSVEMDTEARDHYAGLHEIRRQDRAVAEALSMEVEGFASLEATRDIMAKKIMKDIVQFNTNWSSDSDKGVEALEEITGALDMLFQHADQHFRDHDNG